MLIVFTFGPSLLLTALKMLEIVTGRNDPREHEHVELARKLLADPRTRPKLDRFNLHQRFQHWVLAICFITLVLTGFPLKFADRALGGMADRRIRRDFVGAANPSLRRRRSDPRAVLSRLLYPAHAAARAQNQRGRTG